jgi:hypothetical protein
MITWGARPCQLVVKVFIILILSCASVFGADTSIQVVTTVRNESGVVSTFDVFTRDGQTNLVRRADSSSGVVWRQVHKFYCQGLLVGDFVVLPRECSSKSKAGSPYTFAITFGPTNEVKSALVSSKDGVLLEAFTATNGVFYPVDASVIRKENEIVRQFLSSAHATNNPSAAEIGR